MRPRVRLTADDLAHAQAYAERKMAERDQLGHGVTYGISADRHERFLATRNGYFGEAAACRYFDIPFVYKTAEQMHEPDISGVGDVRYTHRRDGHLMLHEKLDHDPPDRVTILTLGFDHPVIEFAGWILNREGQVEAFWNRQPDKRRPCFWIPQSRLHPVTELPAALGWVSVQVALPI